MTTLPAEQRAKHELLISRTFAAPRELVFKAWTDPECMAQWAGPKGFIVKGDRLDARPDGLHRACLIAPDGKEHWVSGRYIEVLPPLRLVFTHAWELDDGQHSPETIVSIDFANKDGSTEMTFHQAIFDSTAARDGHEGGWSESFERLAVFLSTRKSDTQ